MKYIYPAKLNLSDIKINENKTIFKINYINELITIYGIIIKLDNINIIKKMNQYEIKINNFENELYKYDQFLFENIPNYKRIISNTNSFYIHKNNKIDDCYDQGKESFYLNIGYVKKMGFFNVPIINIL